MHLLILQLQVQIMLLQFHLSKFMNLPSVLSHNYRILIEADINYLFPIYSINLNQMNTIKKEDKSLQKKKQYQQLQLHYSRVDNFSRLISNNRVLSQNYSFSQDYHYRHQYGEVEEKKILWIGCSDMHVPTHRLIGLHPAQIFVQRNLANLVPPSDINVLAVIQFSVQILKVRNIIVTGHYNCGGIKAAFKKHDHGPLQSWLSHIREIRARFRKYLVGTQQQKQNILTDVNVQQQVYNIARIPIIQQAWKEGQQLTINGLVYNPCNGLLVDIGTSISSIDQLPQEFRVLE